MKGVSEFVLLLLIIIVAVITISVLWLYFFSSFKYITSSEDTSSIGEVLSSCMKIDSAKNNKIYLKNCGDGVVRNNSLKFYFDEASVNFLMSPPSIGKGEITEITLTELWKIEPGNYKIRFETKSGKVERYINVVFPDSCVLALDFDEGEGNIAYDKSEYYSNGEVHAIIRNLIQNPSFENDKQGWGSGGNGIWNVVSSVKYHESKSSVFQDLTGDSNSAYAGVVRVPVTPGQSITISAYSKGNSVERGSESWQVALLIGRWEDSNQNEIGGLQNPYTDTPDIYLGGNSTHNGLGTWNWRRTYATYPVPPNAAYYRFSMGLYEETKGTLWVDAVQVEIGTTATPFRTTPWVSGKFSYALEFNGIDDYVSIPLTSNLNITGNQLTVGAWIKPLGNSNTGYEWQHLIDNYEGYWLDILGLPTYPDGRGNFSFRVANAVTKIYANGKTAAFRGNWYNVLGVVNTSHVLIYVNGSLDGSAAFNGNLNASGSTNLLIGRYKDMGDPDFNFNGTIDSVRIYNKALTPDETVSLTLGELA